MSNLQTIREAIQSTLETAITDCPVFAYVTDSAPTPCAWIEPDDIDYLQVMRSDTGEYELLLTIVTGRVNEQAAQDMLDRFISPDGADSVPLALRNDSTLGGIVDYAVATSMERYGIFQMESLSYIGAQIRIQVRL